MSQDVILRGLICSDHFNSNDIVKGSAKREMRLKKGAVPIILLDAVESNGSSTNSENEKIENAEATETSDRTEQLNQRIEPQGNVGIFEKCINCDIVEAELKQLKQEYVKMESSYKTQLCNLGVKLDTLQSKLRTQTDDSKLLQRRLEYAKNTKRTLQTLLRDLKEENEVCTDVVNFVQVR